MNSQLPNEEMIPLILETLNEALKMRAIPMESSSTCLYVIYLLVLDQREILGEHHVGTRKLLVQCGNRVASLEYQIREILIREIQSFKQHSTVYRPVHGCR